MNMNFDTKANVYFKVHLKKNIYMHRDDKKIK